MSYNPAKRMEDVCDWQAEPFVSAGGGRQVRGVWLMTDQEEVADAPLMVYASQKSGG